MYKLVQILNREIKLADIKQNIQMRTREDIDRQQKEYFLQQQIKNRADGSDGINAVSILNVKPQMSLRAATGAGKGLP